MSDIWRKYKAGRRRATHQLWANLLAIHLYADEPAIVWQSLGGVIGANARLLLYALPPIAITAPLFLVIYSYFDSVYLQVGVPKVLTVQLTQMDSEVRLETPSWITVDSPPVHILDDKQISWRILATKSARGVVKISSGREVIRKTVDSRF